jgi:hypothetical protein
VLPVAAWQHDEGSRNRRAVLPLAAVRLSLFHPLVLPVAAWQHDEGSRNRRAVLPLAAVRLSLFLLLARGFLLAALPLRNELVAVGMLPLSFASMADLF